jgi:hypothetical protein
MTSVIVPNATNNNSNNNSNNTSNSNFAYHAPGGPAINGTSPLARSNSLIPNHCESRCTSSLTAAVPSSSMCVVPSSSTAAPCQVSPDTNTNNITGNKRKAEATPPAEKVAKLEQCSSPGNASVAHTATVKQEALPRVNANENVPSEAALKELAAQSSHSSWSSTQPSSSLSLTSLSQGNSAQPQGASTATVSNETTASEQPAPENNGPRYPRRQRQPTMHLQLVYDEKDKVQKYAYAAYDPKEYDRRFAQMVFDNPEDFEEFAKEEQEELEADIEKQAEFDESAVVEDGDDDNDDDAEYEESDLPSDENDDDDDEYSEDDDEDEDDDGSEFIDEEEPEEDEELLDYYKKFSKEELDEEEIVENWLEMLDVDEIDTEVLNKKQRTVLEQQYKHWNALYPNLDDVSDEQYEIIQQSVLEAVRAAKTKKKPKAQAQTNSSTDKEAEAPQQA